MNLDQLVALNQQTLDLTVKLPFRISALQFGVLLELNRTSKRLLSEADFAGDLIRRNERHDAPPKS